jgi:hypothetical protein
MRRVCLGAEYRYPSHVPSALQHLLIAVQFENRQVCKRPEDGPSCRFSETLCQRLHLENEKILNTMNFQHFGVVFQSSNWKAISCPLSVSPIDCCDNALREYNLRFKCLELERTTDETLDIDLGQRHSPLKHSVFMNRKGKRKRNRQKDTRRLRNDKPAAHLWGKSLIAKEQPYGCEHPSWALRAFLRLKGADVQDAV